jgi:hypothetical protein
MSPREANLLWMKDLLEHLTACRGQLEWTKDGQTIQVLTDLMLRDLEDCRRLCESMQAPRDVVPHTPGCVRQAA